MTTKYYLGWCAALLALGLATEACAQQPERESALSPEERAELVELLAQYVPNSPPPQQLPLNRQRWLLGELRVLSEVAPPENQKLVVCETIGDAHLEVGDVIYLTRIGNSPNLKMRVVRNEGMPNETAPWVGPGGGGNDIVVDPRFAGKKHPNAAYKKFTPEGGGQARVNQHSGGAQDHSFTMRRIPRPPATICPPPDPNDTDPDPLFITVPDQHATGSHHGGHAIAD